MRKQIVKNRTDQLKGFNTTVFIGTILLTLITSSVADEVYSKNNKANKLFSKGNYADALKLYDDAVQAAPTDGKLKINRGSTFYKLGNLEKAQDAYNGALSLKDKNALADAQYNYGNVSFLEGEQMYRTGNQSAGEKYQSALEHYTKSLQLRPDDKDAKWNLQLAYARIKQLKDQQNQNKQNNKQDQNKNQQDQNKQDQNQKNQNQQNQDQKNQDQKNQDQQNQNQQNQNEQKNQQNAKNAEEQKKDMKKEEAARLIELYSDDADSLNKPPKTGIARQRRPEKDW
jgi:Ca-activated chloride channel homolog